MMPIRAAIIGLGLIGGSLGLAWRSSGCGNVHVTGYSRNPATREKALGMGAVDVLAETPAEAVKNADVVFLCTPILTMEKMAIEIAPYLKPGAIVTDVGSVKRYVVEQISPLLPPGVSFVGGHPMAGREKSGIEAAVANLFIDKWYIVTPMPDTPRSAVEKVCNLAELAGAKTTVMDVESHDRRAAIISHLPHVAAAALVHLLDQDADSDETAKLIAGGFKDTTRIASSDADMWADICLTNSEAIRNGIETIQSLMSDVAKAIQTGDRVSLHDYFREAKIARDQLLLEASAKV